MMTALLALQDSRCLLPQHPLSFAVFWIPLAPPFLRSCEPEINKVKFEPDKQYILLLCSDGVWVLRCDIDCMARSISKLTEQKLMKKSKLMKSKNLKFLQYVSIHVTVSDWRPEGLRLKDVQNGVGYWDLTHFDGSTLSSLLEPMCLFGDMSNQLH